MEDSEKFQLRKIIEQLESYRGRHTELVSVLIPAGQNIHSVINQIISEQGTASNIKSKNTRKNVMDALERIARHLQLYKKTPENGVAIYCGNISKVEGQPKIELWAIEPPIPLRTRAYRCDQVFFLEPLKEMLEVNEVFGLLVIERREATLGLLEGKNIKVLRKFTSDVPGKIKAGGQSAARFSRLTEAAARDFYRRVADGVKEEFFNMPKLKGILIGGPGPTKEEFLKEGNLTTALVDKIIAIKDIGYSDEFGLKLLVDASQEDIAEQEIIKEKKILQKFFETLGKSPEKAAYGYAEVKKCLERGAVSQLILNTGLKIEIIEELKGIADTTGAEVFFVSSETSEGEQFKNIGGIGGILRFSI